MQTKRSVQEKQEIVSLFNAGKSAAALSIEHNVPRSLVFDVSGPNRVWVSDTTCFKVKEKYYYICVIIDLFSRKIVAYKVSPKHSTYLITSTLKCALEEREYPMQLAFHSDQGTQYTAKALRNLLRMNNVVQSFSRSGKPHDNAVAVQLELFKI